ncbi:CoA-binding protein [Catenuloplanes atrovinosus]|uniref:CoA-binding protein n=1 Tax=Catenuloplanes atrovinosus TaxID=137266 RepID=A0AAE3YVC8_9ACTN|nr:CoA-binding protein [Catenuloplanes atrovinosus]MDR7280594.1 putative CoA-binding protein [Catenuloplanes atrovinosus]
MSDPREILAGTSTIVVVGASRDPDKPAHSVPMQMMRHGWRIVPVNPFVSEIFGVRAYPSLADVPEPLDMVNVFRPSADALDVVKAAVELGARSIWLQQGIVNAQARRIAEAAGIPYVEDRCLAVERALGRLSRVSG